MQEGREVYICRRKRRLGAGRPGGFYGGKFDGAAAELEEGCAAAETEHLDSESFCRRNAKDHVATLARLRLIRASSGNLPSTVICFLYLSFTTRAFGYSFLLPKFPRDSNAVFKLRHHRRRASSSARAEGGGGPDEVFILSAS